MEKDRFVNHKIKLIKHPSLYCSPPSRQKLIKLKSIRLEKTCIPHSSSRVSTRQKTIQKLESVILMVKTVRKAELHIMQDPFLLILKRSNGLDFHSILKSISSKSISNVLTRIISYSRSVQKLTISRPESSSFIPKSRPARKCLVTREFSYTLPPARFTYSPASNFATNSGLSNQISPRSPSTSFIFPVLLSPQNTNSPLNRSIGRFSQEIEDNFNNPTLQHSQSTWEYWEKVNESSKVNYETQHNYVGHAKHANHLNHLNHANHANHVNYFNSLGSVDHSIKLDKSNHLKPNNLIKHHQNLQSFDLPNMSSFESLPISMNYEDGKTLSHDFQLNEEASKFVQYGQEDLVEFAEVQDLEEINKLHSLSPASSYEKSPSQELNSIKSASSRDSKQKNKRYAVLSSSETLVYESLEQNVKRSTWNKELPKCFLQFFEEDSGQVEVSFKDYEEKISTCVSLQSNSSYKTVGKGRRDERELKEVGFESLRKNMKERKCLYKGLELLSRFFFVKTQEVFNSFHY